jgi:hypothetical protein
MTDSIGVIDSLDDMWHKEDQLNMQPKISQDTINYSHHDINDITRCPYGSITLDTSWVAPLPSPQAPTGAQQYPDPVQERYSELLALSTHQHLGEMCRVEALVSGDLAMT